MKTDREERIEERREAKEQLHFEQKEKAADRAALIQMIVSAVGGYFGAQEKGKRKRKPKKDKCCYAKRANTGIYGNSSSSSDSSSDSEQLFEF